MRHLLYSFLKRLVTLSPPEQVCITRVMSYVDSPGYIQGNTVFNLLCFTLCSHPRNYLINAVVHLRQAFLGEIFVAQDCAYAMQHRILQCWSATNCDEIGHPNLSGLAAGTSCGQFVPNFPAIPFGTFGTAESSDSKFDHNWGPTFEKCPE